MSDLFLRLSVVLFKLLKIIKDQNLEWPSLPLMQIYTADYCNAFILIYIFYGYNGIMPHACKKWW